MTYEFASLALQTLVLLRELADKSVNGVAASRNIVLHKRRLQPTELVSMLQPRLWFPKHPVASSVNIRYD